ncbi:exosortase H-associated membrane protein [Thiocapsa sp. UBA6158]|uniref:exosortase H-associated membrane protein n=1 Tax=Thiocapsa sp. UBA6158 TaxID=1947692 RepID=UPI0025D50590|nr:exosortase H-associated membrane protein [Thiocapsa sp. UBA6158]
MAWRDLSLLTRFTVYTLLWLPVCFAAWYFLSILSILPLSSLMDVIMTNVYPQLIGGVRSNGNELLVQTFMAIPNPQVPGGPDVAAVFKVNPLPYGYGIPMYTALVLASPIHVREKAWRWAVGLWILGLVQTFGVATNIIKILAFQMGEGARERLGFSPLAYEGVAIAYQIGYLILPAVSPILIWVWQFRGFVSTLTESPSSRSKAPWLRKGA